MNKVYVFLAEGFEEIEAVTPIDLLRRADVQVVTVGLGGKRVAGAHGIVVEADRDGAGFELPEDAAMVVLPGGSVGTDNLKKSDMIAAVLDEARRRDIYIAAICAAPTVLYKAGLLEGRRVTAFPTVQSQLQGAQVTAGACEVDGKIITARSAGVALHFAHALIEAVAGKAKADEVIANIYPE